MKARIENNKFIGIYSLAYLLRKEELTIDWQLTEVLPSEEELEYISLMFDFATNKYYEGATPEEIAESEKEIVPEKVEKSNFKLALIKVGISTSVITEAIYAMPASLQKDKIIILWEDTDVFYRKDESLNEMAPSFNITQEQLDQLFILADTL